MVAPVIQPWPPDPLAPIASASASAPAPTPAIRPLTARWTQLRYHEEQQRLWHSKARFRVVPAGRRSGKTELLKRFIVKQALSASEWPDPWYVCAAPTLQQARRIYWRDLKMLIPVEFRVGKPRESELSITLINGAEITVLGMDTPERIEGRPLNGVGLDEYGNMKERVWFEHVRPALSDRLGWAWMIGVPEGRNHYWEMYRRAQEDTTGEWDAFHWHSVDILDPREVASAKRELDPLTFAQEYEGSFINFEGRAYYCYDRDIHAVEPLHYEPTLPLLLAFDFNVAPGVMLIIQEQLYRGDNSKIDTQKPITMVLDEVYIRRDSNTEKVIKEFLRRWAHHEGLVYLYGDATGGAKGSAKVRGSDWAIIDQILSPIFGRRTRSRVPTGNPKERERLNAVNSRLQSADGTVRCLLHPERTRHLQMDFEGVVTKEDGSGELDKKIYQELTHISDAAGYYIEKDHPVAGVYQSVTAEY